MFSCSPRSNENIGSEGRHVRGEGAAGQPTSTSRGSRVLVGSSPFGFDSELNQFSEYHA